MSSTHPSKHAAREYRALFFIVPLYLLAGIFGHDPWKQDETYSFGIIYHFYLAHSWLIPMNAGQPFMEKPPLYYWTAALLCRLFSGSMPLHDAARTASVFYMALTCLSLWAASQVLFENHEKPRQMGGACLAILLGCLGLVRHAHDMFTDVALLAGTSAALWGICLAVCKPDREFCAGAVLGAGTGVAFLSKGLAMPLVLSLSGLLLWVMLPKLYSRRLIKAVVPAALFIFPFVFFWPYLLYRESPALFHEWFWNNNIGRFLGFSVDRLGAGNPSGYMLYTVLWFAFPAFPLAGMTLITRRREWRRPEILIPLTVTACGLALLLSSASARALYLLPLLPGLALLASPALAGIPVVFLTGWNTAVRAVISALLLMVIVIWICALHPGGPQPFARLYGDWLPLGFMPKDALPLSLAGLAAFGALWMASFWLEAKSGDGTALTWLCGVTALWGLGNTLLLPWVDETRSFRPVIADLTEFVGTPAYANACIARYRLGESVAPMWEYFGTPRGMGPEVKDINQSSCPFVLALHGKHQPPVFDPQWHIVWRGARILDDKDELELFMRN